MIAQVFSGLKRVLVDELFVFDDDDDGVSPDELHLRQLQITQAATSGRGRAVLTILYVCVLTLCFVIPIFYYCRLHYSERIARRQRDLEIQSIRQALEQSTNINSTNNFMDDSRGVRRKYIEERRAQIKQLFGPVQMQLQAEQFPAGVPALNRSSEEVSGETAVMNANERDDSKEEAADTGDCEAPPNFQLGIDDDDDEDSIVVEIPQPGLFLDVPLEERETRIAPGSCTICLTTYGVGSQIVWSSNAQCEHVFHAECIENWLLRQRGGPLCPCCRREFVIDPLDAFQVDTVEEVNPHPSNTTDAVDSTHDTIDLVEQGRSTA